jgi:hypothetical protein
MTHSGLKSASMLMAMYAMFPETYKQSERIEDIPQIKAYKKAQKEIERSKAAGLKIFSYGEDKYVWALNQKNADRKARSKNWL